MSWLSAPRTIVDDATRALRTEHLLATPKAHVAYDRLQRHYWHWGGLYCQEHELASVAGLSIVSFRRVAGLLSRLFRIDEAGFWRDHALERERDAVILGLGLDPADFQHHAVPAGAASPGTAGAERTPRSEVNRANAVSGWEKRKAQAEQARAGAPEDATMPIASEPMRNGMRNRIGADANGAANRIDFASSHPVQVQDDDDDDSQESSSSSSSEGSHASDADATSHAISHLVSHAGDAKGDANAAPVGGSRPNRPARATVPTKREVLDRVARALGDRARPGLCSLGELAPVMRMLHDGLDLERHVVPVLSRHTREPLKTFAAPWIREEAEKLREAESEPAWTAPAALPSAAQTFVLFGSKPWEAWNRWGRANGHPVGFPKFPYSGDDPSLKGKEGRNFPTLWPEGHEPMVRAAAE